MALTVADNPGNQPCFSWQAAAGLAPLDFWQDFTANGRLNERSCESGRPMASPLRRELAAGETATFTFLLNGISPIAPVGSDRLALAIITTRHADAWAVAADAAKVLPDPKPAAAALLKTC